MFARPCRARLSARGQCLRISLSANRRPPSDQVRGHASPGYAPTRQHGPGCAIEGTGGKRLDAKDNAEEPAMTATALQRANERADAAKAGLSIIVPVYNEAAGLAAL